MADKIQEQLIRELIDGKPQAASGAGEDVAAPKTPSEEPEPFLQLKLSAEDWKRIDPEGRLTKAAKAIVSNLAAQFVKRIAGVSTTIALMKDVMVKQEGIGADELKRFGLSTDNKLGKSDLLSTCLLALRRMPEAAKKAFEAANAD